MGFFDIEILDKITTNPFTIDFTDFTTSIDEYVIITLHWLTVGSSGLPLGAPLGLHLDSNLNTYKNIDNTNNTFVTFLPMVYDFTIHNYWEYHNDTNEQITLPPGVSSITFTLKRNDDNTPISVADYQQIYLRARLQGV